MKHIKAIAIGAAFTTCAAIFAGGSSFAAPFAPITGTTAIIQQTDTDSPIIQVRSRRNVGAAIAAGAAAAIIGGIIASQDPYYPGPYYRGYYAPYYGPYYAAPYGHPAYSGDVAYCMSRFKSFDPYSMTYLGYDGFRHPCP